MHIKCEGCSREPHILTKNCVGTTPVYSVTVDTDNTCFIMSDNFKHKAEAITAWNKAVRGE